jgi:hypothetical protein
LSLNPRAFKRLDSREHRPTHVFQYTSGTVLCESSITRAGNPPGSCLATPIEKNRVKGQREHLRHVIRSVLDLPLFPFPFHLFTKGVTACSLNPSDPARRTKKNQRGGGISRVISRNKPSSTIKNSRTRTNPGSREGIERDLQRDDYNATMLSLILIGTSGCGLYTTSYSPKSLMALPISILRRSIANPDCVSTASATACEVIAP